MRIDAVLFDFDGTLVYTRIDFARMRRDVLALIAEVGIDPAPLRDLDSLAAIARASSELGDAASFRARAERVLLDIELAACAGAEAAPGALETLAWLRAKGVRVGIVTRNSTEAVQRVLESIRLPHDALLTRADTPRTKPDPVHLHLALERLATPPARAIMVGDHPMDVQAGKAAGTRTAGVLGPGDAPDKFTAAAPDAVLHELSELRAFF